MFFDGLVNTPEDVQILRNKRIFYHVLDSDHEVSVLLNDLTKNVAYDHWHECYLSPLIQKIYLRSDKTYLKIMAAIRREYFSSPVNTISYLITFLLLYLLCRRSHMVACPRSESITSLVLLDYNTLSYPVFYTFRVSYTLIWILLDPICWNNCSPFELYQEDIIFAQGLDRMVWHDKISCGSLTNLAIPRSWKGGW